jgi:hypothetical protein
VRLVLWMAAVGTALAIPGLAGAGDPQLAFDVRPAAPIVLESGGRRDALVTLDVHNPSERALRVSGIRITYFEGDVAVKTVDPATSLFVDAGLVSDPRVEPAGRATWYGLCLAPPTARTDRVRFDFELAQRRGLRSVKFAQVLDVPLRAPAALPSLALPFRGTWRVTQGHACDSSHRRSPHGSEFAWDFEAVDDAGRRGTPEFESTHRNDESATFGRPILAPIGGRVVAAVDDVEDNDARSEFPRRSIVDNVRKPRWFFGNYVVVDAGDVYVLLAHLRKGSVAVVVGDVVREGQLVAYTGNSGNTMLPHLHIQVMDRADPADPTVSGVPAVFRDYMEATIRGKGATRESVVRRVASGDPPLDAVVISAASELPAPATP